MAIYEIRRRQWVANPQDEVFQFFSVPQNLQQLTPSFLRFQLIHLPECMKAEAQIGYKLRIHGFPIRWLTVIEEWDPPNSFVDVQKEGPYRLWHHTHRFSPDNDGTWIEDRVRYSLSFGIIGGLAHQLLVKRDVEEIFNDRAKMIREIFP